MWVQSTSECVVCGCLCDAAERPRVLLTVRVRRRQRRWRARVRRRGRTRCCTRTGWSRRRSWTSCGEGFAGSTRAGDAEFFKCGCSVLASPFFIHACGGWEGVARLWVGPRQGSFSRAFALLAACYHDTVTLLPLRWTTVNPTHSFCAKLQLYSFKNNISPL